MGEMMLAAELEDFGRLVLKQVPRPVAGYGEAVVRIRSCGFCATDFKAIKGIRRNVEFPMIPGHEPSGVVESVGPGVDAFKPGDAVIVQPSGYCGVCRHCREGHTHYCEQGFTTGGDGGAFTWPGAFAEFMRTRATCLFVKPPSLSFDAAAITEPLSGAWKGMIQYSRTEVGDSVVIIGVGSIGLLCLMVARAAGAGKLVAVDTSDYALANAMKLGATHAVNPRKGDPKKRVNEIMPEGPDVVLEAAGSIEAVRLMTALRRRGTRWNVFGITTPETFELDGGQTHWLEGRMDASFGTTPLAMIKAIRLMETGLIDTEKIVTHRFPLSAILEAVEVMAGERRNKVIINP